VWLEVCQLDELWQCASDVAREILEERSLLVLHQKAAMAEVFASEKLFSIKKDPDSRERLVVALSRGAELVTDKPFSEASRVRLAELYSESKDYTRAVKVLEKALQNSPLPSHDLWYRLQWNRLQAEQFERLISEEPPKDEIKLSGKRDSKLNEVLATAHLKLLDQAKKLKKFDVFELHSRRFLEYQPSGEVAALVRLEWVASAVDALGLESAVELHLGFPKEWQSRPEAIKQREFLLAEALRSGRFESSGKLTDQWPTKIQSRSVLEASLFARLVKSGVSGLDLEDFSRLDPQVRLHWLSNITLSDPKWALQYLRRNKSSESKHQEIEQKLYLTALRLIHGAWKFPLDKADEKNLGQLGLEFASLSVSAHPLEHELSKVFIPEPDQLKKLSEKKAESLLKKAITLVRDNRTRVAEGLKSGKPSQKNRFGHSAE